MSQQMLLEAIMSMDEDQIQSEHIESFKTMLKSDIFIDCHKIIQEKIKIFESKLTESKKDIQKFEVGKFYMTTNGSIVKILSEAKVEYSKLKKFDYSYYALVVSGGFKPTKDILKSVMIDQAAAMFYGNTVNADVVFGAKVGSFYYLDFNGEYLNNEQEPFIKGPMNIKCEISAKFEKIV